MKSALTIAGSDCSGGAGIQADIKTFAAHGVYGMSAIVSVVAENTCRVIDIMDVTPDMVEKQIDAVFEDIFPDAVKIGMLSSIQCMKAVAGKLRQHNPGNVVIDPVMYAKNGSALMRENAMQCLIENIIPCADVLTPNIPEAENITGAKISGIDDMRAAAVKIQKMGCKYALIKGGHASGDATDVLYDGENYFYFSAPRIDTNNTHGTGCTYSSAIASNLALGCDVREAVGNAKNYITQAIQHAVQIGKGHGPTNHFYRFDGLYSEYGC